MSILQVQNLSKQFGGFTAVDDVSFELGRGEILGFLGPNGAGKTTTIQMLLGVLTPTSGSISFFGNPFATHREEILEKVNFSSTYTNLPWNLSVYENLHFISYLYDIPDRKKALDDIVTAFRLEELMQLTLNELSAGQLTRVNLAKAFINDPQVLLLDEPTASLDPDVAKMVRNFILSKQEKNDLSIIFTSHNMSEVEEVCDRILFINNGRIVADDTPVNLMKTMEIARVRLKVPKKDEHTLYEYATRTAKKMFSEEGEYVIELKEKEIPQLLTELNEHTISYYEIGIDAPDLEDYFLMIAKENKNKDI